MSSKKTNTDQNLSDQQMDEIMEELEQLEKEIDGQDGSHADLKVVSEEDEMEGFRGSSSDASMEETLGHLKDEEEGTDNSIFNQTEIEDSVVAHTASTGEKEMSKKSQSGNDELKMTLSGQMKLVLQMQSDGHEVSISFDSGTLIVEMSDGSEFRIPVNRTSSKLKVA